MLNLNDGLSHLILHWHGLVVMLMKSSMATFPFQFRFTFLICTLHEHPIISYPQQLNCSTVVLANNKENVKAFLLFFVSGIHWWPLESPHKGLVMQNALWLHHAPSCYLSSMSLEIDIFSVYWFNQMLLWWKIPICFDETSPQLTHDWRTPQIWTLCEIWKWSLVKFHQIR